MGKYHKGIRIEGAEEFLLAVNITGHGAPTEDTEAEPGMCYLDEDSEHGDLYKCIGVLVTETRTVYRWKKLAGQEEVERLSEAIANLQISGLTTAQVNALDGMFRIASFTEDPTAAYSAFKTAFGIEGGGEVEPDEPEEPDTPTKTLTGISATYSGGDVAVGTTLTDLTGVVVTATYSDGSTAAVTGYTLSGEIAEGSNTITVSYGGKTTTFIVTGISESVGENNGWVEGEAYELAWNDGYRLYTDGTIVESSGMSCSDYIPVRGVDVVMVTGAYTNYGFATYDNDKNLIQMYLNMSNTEPNPISHGVAYIRINADTSKKESVVVTPHTYDVLTENTVWVAEKKYVLPFDGIGDISNTGVDDESQTNFRTGYSLCYGAKTLYITPHVTTGTNRKAVFFYDESKNFVSTTGWNANYTVEVPQGVKYFRVSGYYIGSTKSTSNPWVYLV